MKIQPYLKPAAYTLAAITLCIALGLAFFFARQPLWGLVVSIVGSFVSVTGFLRFAGILD